MGLVMKQLITMLLGSAVLAMLSGCSSSTAAPVQKVPDRAQPTASLAPREDVTVSDIPIRIPEGRKNPPAVIAKSAPSSPDKQEQVEQDDDPIQAVDYEQNRKQDKSERGNRKNGMRQDGQPIEGKQRPDKMQFVKKSGDDSKKSAIEQTKSADPIVEAASKETTTASSGNTAAATGTTSNPAPSVTPTATTPTVPAAPAAFTVTYGSSTSLSSRNYKKPSQPSNLPSWFTENDKDADGQLTMNEWPSDRFEEFSKYDRNGDGIITIEEAMKTVPKAVVTAPPAASAATTTAAAGSTPAPVTTAPASTTPASPSSTASMSFSGAAPAAGKPMSVDEATRSVERIFPFVDTNKDGFLDAQEIEKTRSIKNVDWKKYDVNKDGKLDKNEAIALFMAEGANLQRGMGGGPGGGGWNSEERTKTMFDNMDKKKTGKITKEDFPGFLRDRFAEFDTNKDGFVDFEEFKTNFSKMMPGRGGPGGGGPGGGRGGQGGGGDFGGRGGRGDNGGRGGRGFGGQGGGF